MPGFELVGQEEQDAVNEIFTKSNGIVFAHGFDALRNHIFRVRDFEQTVLKKFKATYAQAVTSGTSALKIALKALDIQSGDEVITSSFTFIASVEAILEVGAKPVIVDIDKSFNLCIKSLENAITDKTKVIMPVHMAGVGANMPEIMRIAKQYKLLVLEDCAQSLGAKIGDQYLGTIGNMGAYSFDGGKTVTCGEGGMIVTNNENYFIQARAYHDHGHEYNNKLGRALEAALVPGFNYRMSELQAAFALAQFAKLDFILDRQRENKAYLKQCLTDFPFEFRTIFNKSADIGDSLIFILDNEVQTNKMITQMNKQGLGTKNLPDAMKWHFARHWDHLYKAYKFYNDEKVYWQKSYELLSKSIALPIMVKMTKNDIEVIASKLMKIIKNL